MFELHPASNAQGLAELREVYRTRFGRELSEEEAYEILSSVMRFLYLMNKPQPGDEAGGGTPAEGEARRGRKRGGLTFRRFRVVFGPVKRRARSMAFNANEQRNGLEDALYIAVFLAFAAVISLFS